jgi:23S rRNA pseudouridine1911/1915/1917 synthase
MINFLCDENCRLDKFLSKKLPERSRVYLQKLIALSRCFVNKQINTNKSFILNAGDEVEIIIEKEEKPIFNITKNTLNIEVLFENENYAVINKPKNLTVHAGAGMNEETDTLSGMLRRFMSSLSNVRGEDRLGIIHRIDKDTTGCLIIAKNNQAHHVLSDMIKEKTIKRKYLCVVHGCPMPYSGKIETLVDKDPKNFGKMCVSKNFGKSAITNYKVVEIYKKGDYSLVECDLETGRTHQIRLHMQHIKHPILGDKKYKETFYIDHKNTPKDKIEETRKIASQVLHAYRLEFFCPFEKKEIIVEAKLPDEFSTIMNLLKD